MGFDEAVYIGAIPDSEWSRMILRFDWPRHFHSWILIGPGRERSRSQHGRRSDEAFAVAQEKKTVKTVRIVSQDATKVLAISLLNLNIVIVESVSKMKFSSTALNLCAALAASALTAVVQADEHQVIIGLGSKRPEGTHALSAADVSALGLDAGNYMLVSEAFFGGAKLVNVDTYEVSNLIESGPFGARGGIGINYDSASQTVVSCGGGPVIGTVAAIHLGDATTGQHVKSCTLPDGTTPGFLNDLEVIDGIAYITDSGFPRLWSLDIAAALDDENCTLTMEAGLDPDIFSATAEAPFASNGEYGTCYI